MFNDVEVFTGIINYREIEFTFIFDKQQLRLIPPKEKEREVDKWFYKPIGIKGNYVGYTHGEPIYIENPIVSEKCNERPKIVFIPTHSSIGRYNSVLIVDIQAYIVYTATDLDITKINYFCPELNAIFPSNQAIGEIGRDKSGIFTLKTQKLDKDENKSIFKYDKTNVEVDFNIIQTTVNDITKPPLTLQSCMCFNIDKTKDYDMIFDLYYVALDFIKYICYRKDIDFSKIQLMGYDDKQNISYNVAELFIVDTNNVVDEKSIKERRCINHYYIKDIEHKIFNEIINKKLYMRHIPYGYEKNQITAARFVLITAAFEWEYKKLYPKGFEKKSKSIEAEKEAAIVLENLIANNTGKLKQIYKSLLKNGIGYLSLQEKISNALKDLDVIINQFGKSLYSLNREELHYGKIAERISAQRNNYAHGKLDKEFVGLSVLDLIFLERVVYVMQLKRLGLSDINIQYAINDLFHCNIF